MNIIFSSEQVRNDLLIISGKVTFQTHGQISTPVEPGIIKRMEDAIEESIKDKILTELLGLSTLTSSQRRRTMMINALTEYSGRLGMHKPDERKLANEMINQMIRLEGDEEVEST